MTEAESFEKWAAQHQTMDGYPQYTSFDAWVASRRAALEEAAAECDASSNLYRIQALGGDNTGASDHKQTAATELASDIRALADGDKHG